MTTFVIIGMNIVVILLLGTFASIVATAFSECSKIEKLQEEIRRERKQFWREMWEMWEARDDKP
jgi:hypothetical protein